MLEGISYMIGAEVPGVFVNVMRGGPGLGNIAPEQADIKLVCRGLGHGNTHAIVLAPSTPQEMLDLTMLAFDLAFKYRNPVDHRGRRLPRPDDRAGAAAGVAWSSRASRRGRSTATRRTGGNLITSIYPRRARPRAAQRAPQREVRSA